MSNVAVLLGKRVRELRVARGLSQELLAERAGLSVPTLSRIERGSHDAAVDKIVAIMNALGVRADSLFEPVISADDKPDRLAQALRATRLLAPEDQERAAVILEAFVGGATGPDKR